MCSNHPSPVIKMEITAAVAPMQRKTIYKLISFLAYAEEKDTNVNKYGSMYTIPIHLDILCD